MMIISTSRYKTLQEIIRKKSDKIYMQAKALDALTEKNFVLEARIAELEGLLFGYGVIDRTGAVRKTAMERLKIVNQILDKLEERGDLA